MVTKGAWPLRLAAVCWSLHHGPEGPTLSLPLRPRAITNSADESRRHELAPCPCEPRRATLTAAQESNLGNVPPPARALPFNGTDESCRSARACAHSCALTRLSYPTRRPREDLNLRLQDPVNGHSADPCRHQPTDETREHHGALPTELQHLAALAGFDPATSPLTVVRCPLRPVGAIPSRTGRTIGQGQHAR